MGSSLNGQFRKLLAGGGILFIGLVADLSISFLAKAIIARVLGAVDYGAVSLGVTTLGFVSTLTLLGLHSGIGRYLPRFDNLGDRREVVASGLSVALPVSAGVGLTIAVLATPISVYIFTDPSVAPVIRIFGLAVPFASIMKLSIGTMQGLQRAVPRVVVRNITLPLARFTVVAVAIVLSAGAIGIAFAYAVAYLIAALLGAVYVLTQTELLGGPTTVSMQRELLSFSAPLIVSAAMAFLLTDLDTFMLGYFSTTRNVGVYNVVYPIAQLLTVGLTSFSFLLMPVISELDSKGDTDQMARIYQIVTKWIFMATLPVFIVIVGFPEMTITVTFGSAYVDGSLALSLLAVAYFSHAIAGPNANMLTSLGYTRLIMWNNLAIGILNTILNVSLIPSYGFLGAGAATAVSFIMLNALNSVQLYRKSGIHPLSISFIRPGVIAVGLTSVVYVLTRNLVTVTVPVLVVAFGVFMICYIIIILRFGGVQKEEIALVLSFEDRFEQNLEPIKQVLRFLIN